MSIEKEKDFRVAAVVTHLGLTGIPEVDLEWLELNIRHIFSDGRVSVLKNFDHMCMADAFVGFSAAEWTAVKKFFAFNKSVNNWKNMTRLYYQPPSDEAFEEMRRACITLWESYGDPGYVAEKTRRIRVIGNVGDNFMYMFAMLDEINQRKVAATLSQDTKIALRDRMIDGGNYVNHVNELLGL